MAFTITIDETVRPQTATEAAAPGGIRQIYQQTVEELDLLTVINTINRKKRKLREKKAKVQP